MHTLRSLWNVFYTLLFPLTDTGRLVTDATSESIGRLLMPVTLEVHTVGLLPYRHPVVRALIIEAKFHNNQVACERLADILSDYLETIETDRSAFTDSQRVLIPVPLSPGRLKERGYNQIEEILKRVNRTTDPHILVRTVETRPQTKLQRKERLYNVAGAFSVVGTVDPRTQYIVIDDVTTTGATLNEACETLRAAGAKEVYGIALAH